MQNMANVEFAKLPNILLQLIYLFRWDKPCVVCIYQIDFNIWLNIVSRQQTPAGVINWGDGCVFIFYRHF